MVRKPYVLLISMLALALVGPAPALARHKSAWHRFDAVETGTSELTPVGPGAAHVVGHASIHGKLIGNGTLDLDTLVKLGAGGNGTAEGTFKITAQDGSTLRGTSVGELTVAGAVNPVLFRSKVTGGTGRFAGARGWLISRGTTTISSFDPATGTVHTVDEATCKGWIRYGKRRGRVHH
jgi:hypothetical protein